MIYAHFLWVLVLSLVLVACGGGGDGDSDSASTTSLSGNFIDAPTRGLTYVSLPSGLTGTTNNDGVFQYHSGDSVTFSLPLGEKSIPLGSYVPTGNDTKAFVLALENGPQIAQILQSLDHSNSTANLDVSGVKLQNTDIDNMKNYIQSGGLVLPANKTTLQMLSDAQTHSGISGFKRLGGLDIRNAVNHAVETASKMPANQAINAAALVEDEVILQVGSGGYGGSDVGLTLFSDNKAYRYSSIRNGTLFGNNAIFGYWTVGNLLQVGQRQYALYGDSKQGLYTYTDKQSVTSSIQGKGAGTYQVLSDDYFEYSGKMISVTGFDGCDNNKPTTFIFSTNGKYWASYCTEPSNLSPNTTVQESGTVEPLSFYQQIIPGVLELHSSCNTTRLVGSLSGGLAPKGKLVSFIQPNGVNVQGSVTTPIITQVAPTPIAFSQSVGIYKGSCEVKAKAKPIPYYSISGTASFRCDFGCGFVSAILVGDTKLSEDYPYYDFDIRMEDYNGASKLVNFTAPILVPEGTPYSIRGMSGCATQNTSGIMGHGNITNVKISC